MTEDLNAFMKSENERVMRNRFFEKVYNILSNEKQYQKPGDKIGLELEVQIVDKKTLELAEEKVRDFLCKYDDSKFDKELGSSQLEIRTPPIKISAGLEGLEQILRDIVNEGKQFLEKEFDSQYGFLMQGSHPLANVSNVSRTKADKYKIVPSFHNDFKGKYIDTLIGNSELIDVKDAGVISLMSSIQCNLEAKDFTDAIDKMNRSFTIGNYVSAITSNARFLDGKDSGLADVRMVTWEKSHDVRTPDQLAREEVLRIGLPNDYDQNINQYFERVGSQPFILNKEEHRERCFEIGISLNWNDTRIKFNRDKKEVLVEFRPVSTQPTIEENIAAMGFYMGLLQYSQTNQEPLLPMTLVRKNRQEVMDKGLKSRVYFLTGDGNLRIDFVKNVLPEEFKKAYFGLELLGFERNSIDKYIGLMEKRLTESTPADQFASAVYKNMNSESMLQAIVKAVHEKKLVI
ncbi:MAG: hypothetical protein H8D38_04190 [DPANN group archaeon]|nr:hypothetical protein [DPANN group archaeon]